jgi:hypothetical protein
MIVKGGFVHVAFALIKRITIIFLVAVPYLSTALGKLAIIFIIFIV